jgi:hypothetical protein
VLIDLRAQAGRLLRSERSPLVCHTDVTFDRREADTQGSRHLAFAHALAEGLDYLPSEVFGVGFHPAMVPDGPVLLQTALGTWVNKGSKKRKDRGRLNRGAVYDRQFALGTVRLWILCGFEQPARRTPGPPRGRRARWPRRPPPKRSRRSGPFLLFTSLSKVGIGCPPGARRCTWCWRPPHPHSAPDRPSRG